MHTPQHSSKGPLNRLAKETSPYLQQHSGNPVDWYPWGAEAFELARATGKPILLSIGYSACHWCHVMAHESFEDEAIAKSMNELFVNIKVDREERPDVDKIYQLAHHVLAQRGGGWPLTMFLTHDDQKPFFGGTYFPNTSRYGMPSFGEILQRVSGFYTERGEDIRKQNDSLMQVFAETNPPAPESGTQLTDAPLAQASASLLQAFDKEFGGFGGSPKFPHPTNLEFLLRRWRASAHDEAPDLQALFATTLTLTRMAEGGLYDQVGGGFSRYSVDRFWMIPHFEKMLYDNGPLLALYAQTAIATGDPLFKRIATETADWMIRDMQPQDSDRSSSAEGGYWSTLDADSEGHEGKFYVWTPDEVRALVSQTEYDVLARRFGLDREANFEGVWHLHAYRSLDEVAQLSGVSAPEAEALLNSARGKLLEVRNKRIWPGRDEKVLAAWNGLAIRGMAIAARALTSHTDAAHTTRWTDSATRAVDSIRTSMWKDGRLLAAYKDGVARFPAYLDDYAFLLD
ncbi:MAG TPA: thioredoxin domain-containing protein, partial [Steroidobacteraceae bacterium]|nr:thioredoxin domain-containing protein [Steroidobacteraceae bacterium]